MKILITGGTGFIGANVVRAHLARGDRVRCTIRPSSPCSNLEGLDVEIVEAYLEKPQTLGEALDGCEAIQHLAGLYDNSPQGPPRMNSVHVRGTRNLCEAALASGVKRMVLCSSSITIGFGSMENPGNEDSPIGNIDAVYPPGTPLRAYHDSKLHAERMVRDYLSRGLETVIVNPDYVVGPWDIKPTSGSIILAMARIPVPFYPLGGKCFIDSRDCAEGHVSALYEGRPGRRYLLGNHNLDYRSFMTMAARVLGCSPPRLPLPRAATTSLALLGGFLARAGLPIPAALDPDVLGSMQEQRYRDGSRAREELSLPNTPIETSIKDAWNWFRRMGYAKRHGAGSRRDAP